MKNLNRKILLLIIILTAFSASCSFESSFVDLIQDKINTDLGITGEAAEPEISIKHGSTELASGTGTYSFGHMHNDGDGGYASDEITFTIENTGTADLVIESLSLSSGDTVDFDLTDETSASVAPSGSTTFTVRFDPLSSGNKAATVTVTTNDTDEQNYTFSVTGINNPGELSYIGSYSNVATIEYPTDIIISPDNNHVYVCLLGDAGIAWFSRDADTGDLSYEGRYVDSDNLSYPCQITIAPDGKHVYLASSNKSSVAWFSRDTDTGALAYSDKLAVVSNAKSVAVSPDNKNVYAVGTGANKVTWFTRNTDTGALTYAGEDLNVSVPYFVTVSPDGLHVYAFTTDTVFWFDRNATTGALTFVGELTDSNIGNIVFSVVAADGNNVYTTSGGSGVAAFSRNTSTGALSYMHRISDDSMGYASGVALSPDDTTLYVPGDTDVVCLSTDADTGEMTYLCDVSCDYIDGANSAVISADGAYAYITGNTADSVSWFYRD